MSEHELAMTAAPAKSRRSRLESLDGLRGCAAFGVFFFHVNLLMPLPHTTTLFLMGSCGVSFFFVLSGFVLTWSFAETSIARFYRRRAARILPLLTLTTILGVFVVLGGVWATRDVLVSMFGLQAWLPDTFRAAMPNPVVWSLSCEIFFYLLLPFVIQVVRRLPRSALLAIAGLCVLFSWGLRLVLWTVHYGQDLSSWILSDSYLLATYSPIACLPDFLLGVVLASAVKTGWTTRVSVPMAGLALGGAISLLWAWGAAGWWRQLWVETVGQVMIPLFALVIVAAVRRDETGSRGILRTRTLVRLGWWSYAFYLVHFLVLFAMARIALDRTSIYQLAQPSWHHLPYAVVALIVAVVLSWLLFRLFERPLEQLIRGEKRQ